MGTKTTYDPALRLTDHGKRLYQLWRRIRRSPHAPEFEQFPDFYQWAMDNHYESSDRIVLINCEKPFSPDNCKFKHCSVTMKCDEQWVAEWNRTVNRLRKHWGLPPLEGTTYD